MALVTATVYRGEPREITMYYDTPEQRRVVKYRWIRRGMCKIEEVTLVDYDPIKNRWQTQLETQYAEIEGWRACGKKWDALLDEIDATLEKDLRNSTWACTHYYPSRRAA